MSDRLRPNSMHGSSSLYSGSDAASRPYVATPRAYVTSTSATGVPTTTRTYAVGPDRRQPSSARARRSTLDSGSTRPPVIVTTTGPSSSTAATAPHKNRSHTSSSATRAGGHDDHRLYAQPASSIRSRSTARPYHVVTSDRFLSPREVDAYRSTRPSVIYPSHDSAVVDYEDDGYQYTNAGELARYDLDRASSRPRRQESVDRGYYRPNVNYSTEQRSFNVNNYGMNTSRPYDSRTAGPPRSSRVFGKMGSSRDLPPAAPLPPAPTVASQLDASSDRWERNRPLSLHQDAASSIRAPHHHDHRHDRRQSRDDGRRRSRDDDRRTRDDLDRFKDDGVNLRGFGIRTDEASRDRRREPRTTDESIRRSDDFVSVDDRHERRESRQHDDDVGAERERSRLRDKVAAGLSVAATAVGLAPPPPVKEDDKRELRRRRSPDEGRDRHNKDPADLMLETGRERSSYSRDESRLHPEASTDRHRRESEAADRHRREPEAVDRHRRDTEIAAASPSDSDDGRRASRRRSGAPTVFNPNDASDLKQLKEQLAALGVSDKGGEANKEKLDEKRPSRSPSPTKRRGSDDSSRGRELALTTTAATKQVRVVSPPRDRPEEKPLKGILKQPSASFPEDTNPIREGVAPHKEDKKLKEAPPGARWTKINRDIVNPEALTVGKERFEVRDDFVIVLRVLSTEEIQAYAAATQVLRGDLFPVV
ncbi:hypothetical protein CDD80_1009 [Ophiocordyceps camponoti-rufipedis]|uniref:DUF8035 domain-containing protein n=1 Tax=Ophiocordyceps camponoti-rufipedis TaxID=2004952 RepID=A0A2C5YEY6_9HYPO|nr:hypothetical protein CDD80_1009 [Ophiocordyceps camponoti-rufipedis]